MVLVEAHLLCSFIKHNTNKQNKGKIQYKTNVTTIGQLCRSPDKIRSYHVTISITVKYDYMSFITRNLGKRGLVKKAGGKEGFTDF